MGPTQYDWHAYVKGKFGLRGGHAQREGGVKTKGENLRIQEARKQIVPHSPYKEPDLPSP